MGTEPRGGEEVSRSIEILYFEDCPHWRNAVVHVREVVHQTGLEGSVDIKAIPVETEEQAQRVQFLGSPTVRVDGHDVEPVARDRTDFGLQCRVYQHGGRFSGVPSADLIRAALAIESAE